MRYANIIAKAWEQTQKMPKTMWFAFVPSFIGVLVFVVQISWQVWLYMGEFGQIETEFSWATVKHFWDIAVNNSLIFWIILGVIIGLLFTLILPAWITGVVVTGVKDTAERGQEGPIRVYMVAGWRSFVRIFKGNAALGAFKITTILLWSMTAYRYLHDTAIMNHFWTLLFIWLTVAMVVSFFTFFYPQFIVYQGEKTYSAIRSSMSLVFVHFEPVMFMMLMMLLVHVRILLNALMIFIVPMVLFGVFSFGAYTITTILGVLVALGLMVATAYITALVEVFQANVWLRVWYKLEVRNKVVVSTAA